MRHQLFKSAFVVAAAMVLAGAVACSGGESKQEQEEPSVSAPVDSSNIRAAEEATPKGTEELRVKDSIRAKEAEEARKAQKAENVAPQHPVSNRPPVTSGTKDLGYATFKGSWPDDVNGRLVFKTAHQIDSRDPRARMAEAGDYVIGEFVDGHLVQGIWYGADNQVKGSIIIGR